MYEISITTDGSKIRMTEFYGRYMHMQKEFRSPVSATKFINQRISIGAVIHPACQATWQNIQDRAH